MSIATLKISAVVGVIPAPGIIISCRPNSGKNSTKEAAQNNTDTVVLKKSTIIIKNGDAFANSPEKITGIRADSIGGNPVAILLHESVTIRPF
ncbi:hypothetical protein [Mucilaginibacter sp. OK098]|uniref:hypothetical protein n=1 Tax=Mucilaginibacter sp. OK098 TaxID=1855297 RepID=UPI0009323C4E|nr:hypothetical protein [Mucilaginibacter sp. OK098]